MSRAEDIRIVRQLIIDFVPTTAFGERSTVVGDALERFDRIAANVGPCDPMDDAPEWAKRGADAVYRAGRSDEEFRRHLLGKEPK